MTPDLPDRAQALFDRFKAFPEAKFTTDGAFLRRDAYLAFLDLRQMMEREILPALAEHRGCPTRDSAARQGK